MQYGFPSLTCLVFGVKVAKKFRNWAILMVAEKLL